MLHDFRSLDNFMVTKFQQKIYNTDKHLNSSRYYDQKADIVAMFLMLWWFPVCLHQPRKRQETFSRHTIKGLTWSGFATISELGSNRNDTLSPHGVLVTWNKKQIEVRQCLQLNEQRRHWLGLISLSISSTPNIWHLKDSETRKKHESQLRKPALSRT